MLVTQLVSLLRWLRLAYSGIGQIQRCLSSVCWYRLICHHRIPAQLPARMTRFRGTAWDAQRPKNSENPSIYAGFAHYQGMTGDAMGCVGKWILAAPQGFEPRYADPESAVLPLNEGAASENRLSFWPIRPRLGGRLL